MPAQPGTSPSSAVLLSYAREDAEAARRLAEGLRAAGVEVAFGTYARDEGEDWENGVRRQVRECALFVPLVSAHTQARTEGHFRLEWHHAEQRSRLMAKGRAFIVPVGLDGTSEAGSYVPEGFLGVPWARTESEAGLADFVAGVRHRLAQPFSVPPSAKPAATPERPVVPDYDLIRLIGSGSYGDVWLARGATGLWRAVKLVWRARFAEVEPFEREWRGLKEFAAISLGEAAQMALLHVGRNDEAGFFYYVMELADDAARGREIDPARYVPLTLTQLRRTCERLPAADCVRYGVEIARVLASLHGRGLVHRDIKPSNVILVNGVAKLADIGLVAPVASARTFVGTEGYVPPEGPGAPGGDVFALGKVLYELATGLDRQEFPQLPAELGRQPDHEALLALNAVILRACEARPEKRYRDATALLADLEALQAGKPVRRFARWPFAAAAAFVLLAGAGGWWQSRTVVPNPALTAAVVAPLAAPKSIAILPLTNLSDDKDTGFFADGVHEDLLTNLALVPELRVVSRTSVMQYRATTKTMKQIGGELGVAYVLEGSVRRAAGKVRVTGQLINTRNDEHVWAKSFDRDLTDIFALQTELSLEIAGALSAVISPQTQKFLARRPTENPAAYDAFLKARNLRNNSPPGSRSALRETEALFKSAVELDPAFAAAWGELAVVHALNVFWGIDGSAGRLAQADAAIARAVRLAPEEPEVIRLLGTYAYYAYRDYARATDQYQKLARLQPNDPTVFSSLGLIQRRQGRWAESLVNLRRAVELDPANVSSARALLSSFQYVRRWDDARIMHNRIVALLPGQLREEFDRARGEFAATGSLRAADDLLARLSPAQRDAPQGIFWRRQWSCFRGDYAEFKRLDQFQPAFEDEEASALSAIDAGGVYWASGDTTALRARIEGPLAEWRERTEREPTNVIAWSYAGVMAALLGDAREAVESVRKATELMPVTRDAIDGPDQRIWLAGVYAVTGDKDRAIAELARYFEHPGRHSVASIRSLPDFARIRGDPRFEALLDDPKNNAPLF